MFDALERTVLQTRIITHDTRRTETGVADSAPAPDALESKRVARALVGAVKTLPRRYRVLIELYYFDDLTLAEVGKKLKISKSRACRLHALALAAIKQALPREVIAAILVPG
jgi:RNA polymerase sigma factor for flagellar operon FliA